MPAFLAMALGLKPFLSIHCFRASRLLSASFTGDLPVRINYSAKTNKFRAKRTVYLGIAFASKAEAKRYAELRLLERAGEILNLEVQPSFDLIVGGHKVGKYVGDFRYTRKKDGQTVIEDVKSEATRTPLYRLKAKILHATLGISITEVM